MKSLLTDKNSVSGNATIRWGDTDLADAKTTSVTGGSSSSSSSTSPANISGAFDESYAKATGGYAPFVGDHSKIDQLQSLYGTVGDAFDVSGTVSALDKSRRTNLLTGEAAANDAASKFQETQGPGTQSGTAASLIRARALLPFLNADTEAAAETGKYVDSAKQNALKTGADIASTLATLEQNYTNSLASYNSDKANFGLDYAKGQTGTMLQAQSQQDDGLRLGLQAKQMADENNRQYLAQQEAQRQARIASSLAHRTAPTAAAAPQFYYQNNLGQRIQGSPAF